MFTRKKAVAGASALAVVALLAGCSGNAASPSERPAEFPESEFPASTYNDLPGDLAVYDSGGGGVNTEIKRATTIADFTALTGVEPQLDFQTDATVFFASADAGQVPWSVAWFSTEGDFIKARDAGQLAPLGDEVPTDLLEEGTYDEYGYSAEIFGINLAWNTDAFPEGSAPTKLSDIFDTEKFPGKRCMYQYPQFGGTLESALLADGVAPEDLYPLDVDRALAKLDTIKDDIVWWSDGDESIRLLTTGECDLGMTWSGRVFNAVNKDNAPLALTWDEALYTSAYYALPKNAPNEKAGRALLAMMIQDKQGLIDFVDQMTYITPRSDIALDEYDEAVQPFLAVGDNVTASIREDAQYYAENISDLVTKFNSWVSS